MPQKYIEYGGTVHQFPDTFTDQDIQFALQQWEKMSQPKTSEAPPLPTPAPIPGLQEDPRYAAIKQYVDQGPVAQIPGVTMGAAKSVGRTVMAVPDLGRRYVIGIPESEREMRVRQILQPSNPVEALGGKIGEQVQYALPAMATGGASLPIQMAAGALGSALVAQGAGQSPEAAGVIGAAAPVVGAMAKGAVTGLRKAAQERVASAIGPSGYQEKQELSKVLPEITARKPFAWSSEALTQQFRQKAEDVALALDQAIDAAGTGRDLNANAIARKIEPIIESLKVEGRFATPEAEKAAAQLVQVQNEIKELGRVVQPYSPVNRVGPTGLPPVIQKQTVGASRQQLRALKQKYDEIIAGASDHFYRALPPESRATAAKIGRSVARDAMVEATPQAGELGKEYQRLATVRNILERNEIRNVSGQRPGIGRVAELGAVAGSVATGSPQGVIGAGTLTALLKFTNSTPFKLASANLRTAFANALESGDITTATNLMGQMTRHAAMRPAR